MRASELQVFIDLDLLRALPEEDRKLTEKLASIAAANFVPADCFRLGVAFGIRQERGHKAKEEEAELFRMLRL